jgi:predicted methyltransferase
MRVLLASTALAALALAGCATTAMTDDAMADDAMTADAGPMMMSSDDIMVPDYIEAAVASSDRPAADVARDVTRYPDKVLALSGVKPGDHVVEFAGFGQYYTRMLADIVGPEGSVDVYDLPYTDRFAGEPSRAFDAAHDNVSYHQGDYNEAELPQNVDVVYMVLYYHDLAFNGIDVPALDAKIYNALKPGGTFLVVDHKAEDGSGRRDSQTIHRIDVDVIRQEVTAAGFDLEVDSDLLAHPEDDRTLMVFDENIRGKTDRALFVFKKPEM